MNLITCPTMTTICFRRVDPALKDQAYFSSLYIYYLWANQEVLFINSLESILIYIIYCTYNETMEKSGFVPPSPFSFSVYPMKLADITDSAIYQQIFKIRFGQIPIEL